MSMTHSLFLGPYLLEAAYRGDHCWHAVVMQEFAFMLSRTLPHDYVDVMEICGGEGSLHAAVCAGAMSVDAVLI